MGAPQIIMIFLAMLHLVLGLLLDGETRSDKHSFSAVLVGTVIGQGLLIWGRFYV